MKAIINCTRPEFLWPRKFFGNISAYMLPFLGKPLIEYYLDWCSLSGINDVLILSEDYDEDFEAFISDGSRWGLNIKKSTTSADSGKEEILMKNSSFAGGGIIFMNGFFFPFYDKDAPKSELHPCFEGRIFMTGSMCVGIDLCAFEAQELDSLGKYFDINMSMLGRATDKLIMKGYGTEPGVFMGMNDVVMRGANLYPPFVLGDNVQIEIGVRIGPCSVIGNTCIIDRRTSIENSIVFDKTYVGADLDIRSKILCGGMIIDPHTEETLTFSDNFFSADLSKRTAVQLIRRIVAVPAAIAIAAVLFPAYAAFLLIGLPKYKTAELAGAENSVKYKIYEKKPGWKNAWFFKLSLDKMNLLKIVAMGKIRLIGDTLRPKDEMPEILKRYKHYDPGAFSYAESLGHAGAYDTLIDDLFYKHARSIKNDFQILLKTFTSRLFKGER